MSSTLHRTIAHAMSTVDYWRVLRSAQYWPDLAAATPGTEVKSVAIGDDVKVVLTHTIPESTLPAIVTKIRPGDLHIVRTIEWTQTGDTLTGTFSAAIEGVPAGAEGSSTVSTDGGTCVEELNGSASVAIPFIGGKVESMIVESLDHLFDTERQTTDEWFSAHSKSLIE